MKRFYKLFLLTAFIGAIITSCDVDSTNHSLDDRDVYIESIVIEAAKNNCIEEDIEVSVVNYDRSITASLPETCDANEIVLTIYLKEGITTSPATGESIVTGESTLLVTGFGLEEEYTVNLKV